MAKPKSNILAQTISHTSIWNKRKKAPSVSIRYLIQSTVASHNASTRRKKDTHKKNSDEKHKKIILITDRDH